MWKDILKVDNIIFDKDKPAAFHNPYTNEITLNLTNVPTKDKTEEEIILDLEEIIIHESAHKAVSSEIKHLTDKFIGEFAETFVEVVNTRFNTGVMDISELVKIVVKLIEIVSLDEAYAYSTGATVRRVPKVNVVDSTVLNIRDNLLDKLVKDVMSQIVKQTSYHQNMETYSANIKIREQAGRILKEIRRDVIAKMVSATATIELTVKQFVADMNKLSPDETLDFMIQTAKKIGMV